MRNCGSGKRPAGGNQCDESDRRKCCGCTPECHETLKQFGIFEGNDEVISLYALSPNPLYLQFLDRYDRDVQHIRRQHEPVSQVQEPLLNDLPPEPLRHHQVANGSESCRELIEEPFPG